MSKDGTKRDPRALGLALRIYRGNRSSASVADACSIQRWRLTAYERGDKVPEPKTLERIAEALGITVPAILSLADLLGCAPEILNGGADAEGVRVVAKAARWARSLRFLESLIHSTPPPLRLDSGPTAEELWAHLEPYSAAQRRAVALENPEYHEWRLSLLLCDASLEAAADDPAEALEIAKLAELIAGLVPGSTTWRFRLQGYCAVHVCSAFRVSGKISLACRELDRADALWRAGEAGDSGNLIQVPRVLGLTASLRRDQGRLQEAHELLEKALASNPGAEAKFLLLNLANILWKLSQHEMAVATLGEALPHIDPEREPHLLLQQRFNLAVNLTYLERYAEAAELMDEVRGLAEKAGTKGMARTRMTWLEGTLAAGLGRAEEAERLLTRVREEFLARENGFETALVSLDLAMLYLRQGRTGEVKTLAAGMAALFREQKVHRETLAAVLLFREAADRESATVELTRRLAEYLRRAQHEEGLRFGV